MSSFTVSRPSNRRICSPTEISRGCLDSRYPPPLPTLLSKNPPLRKASSTASRNLFGSFSCPEERSLDWTYVRGSSRANCTTARKPYSVRLDKRKARLLKRSNVNSKGWGRRKPERVKFQERPIKDQFEFKILFGTVSNPGPGETAYFPLIRPALARIGNTAAAVAIIQYGIAITSMLIQPSISLQYPAPKNCVVVPPGNSKVSAGQKALNSNLPGYFHPPWQVRRERTRFPRRLLTSTRDRPKKVRVSTLK